LFLPHQQLNIWLLPEVVEINGLLLVVVVAREVFELQVDLQLHQVLQ
jgi:hypothetical protein